VTLVLVIPVSVDKIYHIPEGLDEEERKMMLDPLGYDAIKDIDEIYSRNRRKSDDPYIKATMENADYKRWKDNPAERR
tara:strand:- start:221 stop:454 length:234 start_codon:yes stop_codon:yes gene_type:complete